MPRPLLPHLLAAATAAPDAATDAELLRRFVREGDASAFELVVRRHAGAVWTACRRILPEADAEDAFQAAFLVLARKAGAVRSPSAGGWLHRVAVTAALKVKARGRTVADAVEVAASAPDPLERAELAAAVHEELARLPDRYRLPVVLCDLEGETQPAAAARLGWPVGSVAGRLSRARALLRDRLTRRGFAPVGSILVLPLLAVPASAVTSATTTATGAAAPTASVSVLASGVLTAMRIAKLKLTATVLTAAGLVGAAGFGTYSAIAQPLAAPQNPPGKAPPPPAAPDTPPAGGDWLPKVGPVPTAFPGIEPVAAPADPAATYPFLHGPESLKIEPTDDTHRRLLKAQLNQYRQYLLRMEARFQVGQFQAAEYPAVTETCERIRAVAAELYRNDARALDGWLVDLVRMAKAVERMSQARVDAGVDQPQVGNFVTANRLAMEAALWKHRNPGR